MNAKRISLALATLALLSTGSVFAQSVDINTGPVGVSAGASEYGVGVGANVLGVGTNVGVGTTPVTTSFGTSLMDRVFSPPHGWFDISVLGAGINIGGEKKVVQTSGIPGAMIYRSSEYARVLPGQSVLGTATPVHAIVEGPKPMFHFDLFGGRMLKFGPGINPDMDMRHD